MNLKLTIPSMACSACADTITKVVRDLDSEARVEANLTTKVVEIETKAQQAAIAMAISEAGYPVSSV